MRWTSSVTLHRVYKSYGCARLTKRKTYSKAENKKIRRYIDIVVVIDIIVDDERLLEISV